MSNGRLPRKLAAILYADVAGYSRLTGDDEDATHRAVREYLSVLATEVEGHGGRIVHYAGDAVLATFGAAVDALAAALRIQSRIRDGNDGLPEHRRVRFRIGLNLSDVIEDRGDVYGDGVNVAARLEGLAEPGGICISDAVRAAVGSKLDVGFESLGEPALKNIAKPVRAYRVALDTAAEAAPGAAPTPAMPDRPSIAVTPFSNLGGLAEHDYFCDGITQDIVTALSRVSDLLVLAHPAGGPDATPDPREVRARFRLDGSVQASGERVRVTAQLADVASGLRVWAQRFDRELDDILAIQDEITREVVVALQVKLTAGEMARQWAGGTRSREAWQCLLTGRAHHLRFNAEDNAIARREFERALQIDPGYGNARVWLGFTHWIDAAFAFTLDPSHSLAHAREQVAALHATEHGRELAHLLVGSIHLVEGDHDAALAAARAAVEFSHGAGDHANLAMILNFAGRPADAIEAMRTAVRLSPYPPSWFLYHLAVAHLWHGELETAARVGTQYVGREPDDPFGYAMLAIVASFAGRAREAGDWVARALERSPPFTVSYFVSTQRYRDRCQRERIRAALVEAGLPP